MSLKAFHIVFVVISTILALGFGIWAIRQHQARSEPLALAMGVVSLLSAVGLIVYGRWFLKKLKKVSYL